MPPCCETVYSFCHGCSGALRHLLAKIAPDEKSDRLILLGDLYDRGPDSWGVICIDTGCGKGGRLTGMVIEDGKFILHSVAEM